VNGDLWQIAEGQEPIVAAAIHDGHELRDEVAEIIALSDAERLREEDPYTGIWTTVATNQIIPRLSRFEVDLNRPGDRAVYLRPEDAWDLKLWKREPSSGLVERSLDEHGAFYRDVQRLFSELERRYGRFVVLDLHSYNHRRAGPGEPPADPRENPEVNVGTGTMDRSRWASLVDRFIRDLSAVDFMGRHLDVRENVKFRGGYFPRWIHETFPESACCLAVEVKKFFMDEWTGELSEEEFEAIPRALTGTVAGLLESLKTSS
jgi:N-formylglutamate amidohydrolase